MRAPLFVLSGSSGLLLRPALIYGACLTNAMHCPSFLNCGKLRQPSFLHCALLVGTRGSGPTAMPRGALAVMGVGTVAGLFGDRVPVWGLMSYCETLASWKLVT